MVLQGTSVSLWCPLITITISLSGFGSGIRDHGSVTASAGSITLDISILVGADATGHPNVTTTGCSFDAGHLKVKLHGGAR